MRKAMFPISDGGGRFSSSCDANYRAEHGVSEFKEKDRARTRVRVRSISAASTVANLPTPKNTPGSSRLTLLPPTVPLPSPGLCSFPGISHRRQDARAFPLDLRLLIPGTGERASRHQVASPAGGLSTSWTGLRATAGREHTSMCQVCAKHLRAL